MYRTIADFLTDWKYERRATLSCIDTLTNLSLSGRITPDHRTLGQLAWHLADTNCEMMTGAGLSVTGVQAYSTAPDDATKIRQVYEDTAEQVAKEVAAKWTDGILEEEVALYGQTFRKGDVLSMLIHHQIHHRGQMTVLMRQAGLSVPGIYGPSKEEWAAMSMPSPI